MIIQIAWSALLILAHKSVVLPSSYQWFYISVSIFEKDLETKLMLVIVQR